MMRVDAMDQKNEMGKMTARKDDCRIYEAASHRS